MTSSHLKQRREMVANHIAARGVRDSNVLKAMLEVPRERFVPEEMAEFVYEFIWFDATRAVAPIETPSGAGIPETYPFGL